MVQKVRVAIDVMGGDYAPLEPIKGAVKALEKDPNLEIILVGNKPQIQSVIRNNKLPAAGFEIVEAKEVIETSENPVKAIRTKKDSSLVKALELVRDGEADAFISSGNSGAIMVGAQTILGKIKGITRPTFAPIIPTSNGPATIVDSGANMDARPDFLTQWAVLGSVYMQLMFDMPAPRVAIVNVGAEEDKGNKLVKETFPLLKEMDNINFTGSIESRNIPSGDADVIVCDAFVGNAIVKMYEGVAKTLISEIKKAITSSFPSKIGSLLVKGQLKSMMKTYDVNNYGGAAVLGLNGLVIKTHGNAKEAAFASAFGQVSKLVRGNITGKIKEQFAKMSKEENKEVNGIASESFDMMIGNIIDDKEVQDKVGYECYDIVVANILADVLVPLTPVIVNQMKPGAVYITSGIIDDKEQTVVDAVKAAGLEILEVTYQGEWVSVTARKQA